MIRIHNKADVVNDGDLVDFWGQTLIVLGDGADRTTLTCQYLDGDYKGEITNAIPLCHIYRSKKSIIDFL